MVDEALTAARVQGLRVSLGQFGEVAQQCRSDSRDLMARRCDQAFGAELHAGELILDLDVGVPDPEHHTSRNAKVITAQTSRRRAWVRPLAISRFLTEFGIAGGEFV